MVRYLRLLVSVLTATMILGFLVIVALFVIRFSEATPIAVPDRITLPDGTIPMAYTKGNGWYAVVTADNQILIFDAQSGVMRQTIEIDTSP